MERAVVTTKSVISEEFTRCNLIVKNIFLFKKKKKKKKKSKITLFIWIDKSKKVKAILAILNNYYCHLIDGFNSFDYSKPIIVLEDYREFQI